MNSVSRNMASIFLTEEDRIIDANKFLDNCDDERFFNLRRKIEEARNTRPIALCNICFQPVVLRGNTHRTKFFAHTRNSEDCPIKTTTQLSQEEILTMKYNGQKEGKAHRENKIKIVELLVLDQLFTDDIQVESTFRETNKSGIAKRWRRPDIRTVLRKNNFSIVFELQVSTTFLKVIISREAFYRQNETYILWVFLDFDAERFTTLDIAYSNNTNVFVFDDEAREKSEHSRKLIFKCYYKKPYVIKGNTINYTWEYQLVDFDCLSFNEDTKKIYFIDTAHLKILALKEISCKEKEIKELRAEIELARKMMNRVSNQGEYENKEIFGKSFGDAVQCASCGYIGKERKIGNSIFCSKCLRLIN
ncbi:DUF6035 family protein [Yersinia similis]|uniref:Competence protein n=1 Tax=Yersinia similis TaxID=367190 RepID=A0A0T9R298_9GAMM|nr:DUF6035 family protein [Yersinia similis]CNG11343.1 Competence protein [Yersinia similis]CNI41006.1 Competence protein [Yersinia similis]